MSTVIRYWDVKQGNLESFGDKLFDKDANRAFNADLKEAVRKLTIKILESDVGSGVATRAYRKTNVSGSNGKVITAIRWSENGLTLKVKGEEEVAIREISSLIPEIQKVREALQRQRLIPVATMNLKIKEVYERGTNEINEEARAPTFTSQFRSWMEKKAQEMSNVDKTVRQLAAPILGGIKVFEAIAFAGGILLSISGISLLKNSFNDMVAAQLHDNFEKVFLASADLFASINVIATSVLFLAEKIAEIGHKIAVAAFAGGALPITVLMLYATGLLSAVYKLYVQLKFRREFDAIVGDGKDKEKNYAAIVWLKQRTQISELEEGLHHDENGILDALHKKWEQFTLRTGRQAFEELLDPEKLDTILATWDCGGATEAESLINTIKAANSNAIKWSLISVCANIVGVIAMSIYLAALGPVGTALSSAILVLVTLVSLFVDYPKARKEIEECFRAAKQKAKELLKEWLEGHCAKSEKSRKKEECSSTTSSIISDSDEDSPPAGCRLVS